MEANVFSKYVDSVCMEELYELYKSQNGKDVREAVDACVQSLQRIGKTKNEIIVFLHACVDMRGRDISSENDFNSTL